jgi:hypothetical protein
MSGDCWTCDPFRRGAHRQDADAPAVARGIGIPRNQEQPPQVLTPATHPQLALCRGADLRLHLPRGLEVGTENQIAHSAAEFPRPGVFQNEQPANHRIRGTPQPCSRAGGRRQEAIAHLLDGNQHKHRASARSGTKATGRTQALLGPPCPLEGWRPIGRGPRVAWSWWRLGRARWRPLPSLPHSLRRPRSGRLRQVARALLPCLSVSVPTTWVSLFS